MRPRGPRERKEARKEKEQPQNQKYYVAIHHDPLDPNYFETEVLPHIQWDSGSGPTNFQLQEIMEEPGFNKIFYSVSVGSFWEAKALASLSGQFGVVMSLVKIEKVNTLKRVFNRMLTQDHVFLEKVNLQEETVLYLTNLREVLEDEKLNQNDPFEMSFILFYYGIILDARGFTITQIIFDQGLTKCDGLFNVKSLFPDLTAIFVSERADISDEILGYLATNGVVANVGLPSKQRYMKDPPRWVIPEPPEGHEVTGYLEPGVSNSLDDYEPVQFDVDDFPLCEIIVQLFECGWGDFSEIRNLYRDDSVFTVSVDLHGPDSCLERFDKYAKEVRQTDDDTLETDYANVLIGGDYIARGQAEMFRGQFYAYPISYHAMMLTEEKCAFVIEGVFQASDNELLGFDRSIVVMVWSEGKNDRVAIVNDHIFIRLPRTQ